MIFGAGLDTVLGVVADVVGFTTEVLVVAVDFGVVLDVEVEVVLGVLLFTGTLVFTEGVAGIIDVDLAISSRIAI